MNETGPILLTLTPRHFHKRLGHAHGVPLRHSAVLDRINGRSKITLWLDGRPLNRSGASVQDVAEHGDGRCHLNLPYENESIPREQWCGMLWISLPGNSEPREYGRAIVVELGEAPHESVSAAAAGPLLIAGAQRTGTTALLTALDTATPLRAPQDACMHRWHTLEGFFTIQSALHWLTHPFVSALGSDGEQRRFRTGMFDDSSFASAMLDSLAEHIDRSGRMLAGGAPRWVEKCPGWETSSIGPLFAALFPRGRVIYMTRDPVSCTMSIARLEGSLPRALDSEAALRSIVRNSSVWVVSHLIWRRYGRPRLGSDRMLEVPFHLFQREPAEVVPSIARLLQLDEKQGDALLAALGHIPTPRHPIRVEEIDPAVPSLIRRLCRNEAARWGYEMGECEPVNAPMLEQVCSLYRGQLSRMLDWYQLRSDVAQAFVEANVQGASDGFAPSDEPPLPAPGPLLAARLARERV